MHTRRVVRNTRAASDERERSTNARSEMPAAANATSSRRERPPETRDTPFLEGANLGVYRINAYFNLGIIGIGVFLFGLVTMITGELSDFDALALFVSGATLASFAWRRTRSALSDP